MSPDALAAGPLAGSRGSVMLLVARGRYDCADAAAERADSVRSVTFAGGAKAVPVDVREEVLARLGGGFEAVGWERAASSSSSSHALTAARL